MKRKKTMLASLGGALIAAGTFAFPGAAHGNAATSINLTVDRPGAQAAFEPRTGNLVVDWNSELVAIERLPTADALQPPTVHPTRSYALLATAIYDAVTSTTHADAPYAFSVVAPHDANPVAAADQAAHDVLAALFPTIIKTAPTGVKPLDPLLATELMSVPDGPGKTAGEAVGARTAALILGLRAGDGSLNKDGTPVTPEAFVPTNPPQPGGYQLTPSQTSPPNPPSPAVFTKWGLISPWVLTSGSQFRPPVPPPLSSQAWKDAIKQVQTLGVGQEQEQSPDPTTGDTDQASKRTPDEIAADNAIANFWAPPIWNTWNAVTDGQITQHDLNLQQAAHVLADVNLTLADGAIGFYDAKYTYNFWRPVTAIRAGTSNNPPDPDWLPEAANGATAADPSYPAAHSTESSAAAAVLTAFFGNEPVTITTGAPNTTPRSFASFDAAAAEAGQSRIFAGQHTIIDVNAGSELGQDVAQFVLDQPFGAGHGPDTLRGFLG